MIAIFNRSQYEDVLVARVHELVPPEEWKGRYEEINQFERMLDRNGTLIPKFVLHISQGEQEKRLRAREDNPDKAWKLSVDDWREHAYWDAYRIAYEEALGRCGTRWAPWQVVLADHEHVWRKELAARGKAELAELAAFRATSKNEPSPN
jgi:polyphosphate kinase 2 (PPK2 family)